MGANPYVGEIIMFGGNFAPVAWMFCEGQLLPISGNDALFTLIGTTYGGDGMSTFALPDLRGRAPIHQGTLGRTYTIGQSGGAEQQTLALNQMPAHTHSVTASSSSSSASPQNAVPGSVFGARPDYYATSSDGTMSPSMLANAGGSQPFPTIQPYIAISYCISLFGVYPSPT